MARIDTDLLGLQIIALDSATVVGEVDGLLIDDAQMKVAGFLVDTGLYEASTLPFESAYAVGSDAIIVESADKITEISANPTLETLAEKDVAISEAKAITRSGRGVGIIGDFFVNTETGDVVGMEFIAADQTVYPRNTAVIPASVVVRLGRDMVVLQDDYDKHLMKDETSLERIVRPVAMGTTTDTASGTPASGSEASTDAPAPDAAAVKDPDAAAAEDPEVEAPTDEAPTGEEVPVEGAAEGTTIESAEPAASGGSPDEMAPEPTELEVTEPGTTEPRTTEPGTTEPETTEPETTAAEVEPVATATPLVPSEDDFTSQQKHFLIGKRVLRRIESPAGEVIAEEGDLVTFEMIETAKGCDQLLILSLNVE